MVEVSLIVGKLDASLALLLTKEHHLIEFPTILLPKDVQAGSIVKISCERDEPAEQRDKESFLNTQDQIMQTFGTVSPKAPNLRVRNVTETSAVLEWDPIEIATAEVISLTLYKNGARFGIIPSPLTRTAIKLSGLAIDTAYTFELVLTTTAGTYRSEQLNIKTHKMTDLTGITLCVGIIEDTDIDRADLEETIKNIGAKPLQDKVQLDTTHFVCTVGEGDQWKRALAMNIPVVRPEWIKACEAERRLVSVRAYYLNADPKLRPPVQRSRAASQVTQASAELGHRRAVSEITDSPIKPNHPVNNIPQSVPEESEEKDEKSAAAQEEVNEPAHKETTEPVSKEVAVEKKPDVVPETALNVSETNVVPETIVNNSELQKETETANEIKTNGEVKEETHVESEPEAAPADEDVPVSEEKVEGTVKPEDPSPESEAVTLAESTVDTEEAVENTEEDGDLGTNGDIGGDLAKELSESVSIKAPTQQLETTDENNNEEDGDIADIAETSVNEEEPAPLSKSAKKNQKKKAKKAAAAAAKAAEADEKDGGELEDIVL